MAVSTNPDAIRHLPGTLLLNLGKISNFAQKINTHQLKLTTPDSWLSDKCCRIKKTHLDPHNKNPEEKVNMNTSYIQQRLILSVCSLFHSSKWSLILSSGWPLSRWQTCKLLWLLAEPSCPPDAKANTIVNNEKRCTLNTLHTSEGLCQSPLWR